MKGSSSWQQRTVWTFWILQSFVRDVLTVKSYVGRPDVQGREEILKVHAKGKPLGDDDGSETDRADNCRIYRSRS